MCGNFWYRLLRYRLRTGKEKKEDIKITENGVASTEENSEAKKAETESAGSHDAPTDIVQDSPDKDASGVAVISDVLSPTSQTSPLGEESKDKAELKAESPQSPPAAGDSEIATASQVKSDAVIVETKPEVPTTLEIKIEKAVEETKSKSSPPELKPETTVVTKTKPETPVEAKPETPVEAKPETPVEAKPATPVEETKPATPVEETKVDSVQSSTEAAAVPNSPVAEIKAELDAEPAPMVEETKPVSPVSEEASVENTVQETPAEKSPTSEIQPQVNGVSGHDEATPDPKMNGVNGVTGHEELTDETQSGQQNGPTEVATLVWKNGGGVVEVSGDFNKWEDKCVLHKQDDVFSTKIKLSKGTHHLKYIVDGIETVDDTQPIVELDGHGQVNVLTV